MKETLEGGRGPPRTVVPLEREREYIEERTNQQNAQINFGLTNLLLFNHSDMFRPLNRSHPQGV